MQMFSTFGDIESARVMVDLGTRVSKGYGFVKFRSAESGMNFTCIPLLKLEDTWKTYSDEFCPSSLFLLFYHYKVIFLMCIYLARNAVASMNGFQMGANILTVKPANESVTGQTTSNSILKQPNIFV